MKLKCIIAIAFVHNTLSTIDTDIQEYKYLSKHLTLEECRRLYTSLHFVSYEFPTFLHNKTLPTHNSCLNLLLKWDKSRHKWGGKGKTHVDIQRRLRQMGKTELAEWLDSAVYLKLRNQTVEAFATVFSNKTKNGYKESKNWERIEDWTVYDSILWAISGMIFSTALYLIVKLIVLCFRKKMRKPKGEDVMELLRYGSVDSDEETIYERVLGDTKRIDE